MLTRRAYRGLPIAMVMTSVMLLATSGYVTASEALPLPAAQEKAVSAMDRIDDRHEDGFVLAKTDDDSTSCCLMTPFFCCT